MVRRGNACITALPPDGTQRERLGNACITALPPDGTQRERLRNRFAPAPANVDVRMEDTMDRPYDPGGA
eukprot:1914230-Heterocapsa_arctica.AAC.1